MNLGIRSKDADHVRFDLISPVSIKELADVSSHVHWKGVNQTTLLNYALDLIYDVLGGDNPSFKIHYATILVMAAIDNESVNDTSIKLIIKEGAFQQDPRYDLLPQKGFAAIASAYREGVPIYGMYNCEKGFPFLELMNHCINHISLHFQGNTTENHLSHAVWNLVIGIHSLRMWPQLNTLLRGKGCTLTPAILEYIDKEHENKSRS